MIAAFSSIPSLAQDLPQGFLIHRSDDGRISIIRLQEEEPPAAQSGLHVWADEAGEHVQPWAESTAEPFANVPPQLRNASRDSLSFGGTDPAISRLLAYVEPISDPEVTRGAAFVTPPAQGWLLSGRFSIRRASSQNGHPAAVLFLSSGGQRARLQIPKGQSILLFEEFRNDLPEAWREGLPAGEYDLRIEGGPGVTFFVEAADAAHSLKSRLNDIHDLLAAIDPALEVQLSAELLLHDHDPHGRAKPYLTDALDRLEASPDADSPPLQRLHRVILWQLGEAPEPASHDPDPTGLPVVDRARREIDSGRWIDALALLDAARPSTDRESGLVHLYRAVILAEGALTQERSSGPASDSRTADSEFHAALELLNDAPPSDQFRAHNNLANYQLRRAQDRLHHNSVQAAAGVPHPILSCVEACESALAHYTTALNLAPSDDARAAACVNRSRLYALIADVIQTLDANSKGAFQNELVAAQRAAHSDAQTALQLVGSTDSPGITASVALEVQARLAYAAGSAADCLSLADKARAEYAKSGSLAGMESIYRLKGQALARLGRTSDALISFRVSELLGDILRERFPSDRAGVSRAGFFARRAFVSRRIAELLILQNRPAEALIQWESSKAQSLRDLLRNSQLPTQDDAPAADRTLGDLLKDWPEKTAALEYVLGETEAWILLVDTTGSVQIHQLRKSDGDPVSPQELITAVHQLLSDIRGQAVTMRRRLLAGRGFDHAWQDSLHNLRLLLIPDAVLQSLRQANTVLIVPNHILHYVPFAALVTARDSSSRSPEEMVLPRFLVDEPFTLCHAPSLIVWDQLRQHPVPLNQATAVGIVDFPTAPRLPGVRQDLAHLRKAFGDRVHTELFGGAADETTVKQQLAEPGLLLLATHGANIADQPLESRLLLYPSELDDGVLTAAELYRSDVAAACVVMSACFSGLADRSPLPGDDLFGLQRAFLQSGAKTVISGLWDVYDGTGPLLMQRLFNKMAAGIPAARALTEAQREFLEQMRAEGPGNPWLHPYFWAVYNTSGSDLTRFKIPTLSTE